MVMHYGAPLNPFHHPRSDSVRNRKCRFHTHCLCFIWKLLCYVGKSLSQKCRFFTLPRSGM